MIKIDMQMPGCCMKCLFYRGSHSGGMCVVSEWEDLYFGNTYIDMERHPRCPLQEVDEDE
jgi:hypothetical protein